MISTRGSYPLGVLGCLFDRPCVDGTVNSEGVTKMHLPLGRTLLSSVPMPGFQRDSWKRVQINTISGGRSSRRKFFREISCVKVVLDL